MKPRLTGSLAVNASVLAGAQYLSAGIGFVSSVMVARMLGPTGYGAVTLLVAFPTLVWSVTAVKSILVTTRYLAQFQAARRFEDVASLCKLAYSLDLLSAVAALVLVAGTAPWVARTVYHLPDRWWLMVAVATAFPAASLAGASSSVLLAWSRFRQLAALQLIGGSLSFVLIVCALQLRTGITGVVLATAFGQALAGLILTVGAARTMGADGVRAWWTASTDRIRPLLGELRASFGWSYVAATMGAVITQLPVMMLGRLRGPEDAGFYRIASSIVTVGTQLEGAMGQVAYPTLSAGGPAGLRALLKAWTVWPGLPAAALIAAAIPVLPLVVAPVLGPGYTAMVPGAQIMMIGAAVGAALFWLNAVYLARGHFEALARASILYALIVAGPGWLLGSRWGFLGFATLAAGGRLLVTLWLLAQVVRQRVRATPS